MGLTIKTLPCLIDISVSATVSEAVHIGGDYSLVGITYPAAWTSASITFQVSLDGDTWYDLLDDSGNEITKTVTAAQFRELDASEFKTAIWMKIRSGTSGSPVSQLTSDRTFLLHCRRYLSR